MRDDSGYGVVVEVVIGCEVVGGGDCGDFCWVFLVNPKPGYVALLRR